MSISEAISKLKEYGAEESTINSLFDFSNDIIEEIIFRERIPDNDYKRIGELTKEFYGALLNDVYSGLKVHEKQGRVLSDYEIILAGQYLRDNILKYISKISALSNTDKDS